MILGLGVDLVHIPRLRRLVERWGPAGLERLFHPREIRSAMKTRKPCYHLAGRFAAREALVKAMTGMPEGARWRDLCVERVGAGPPTLLLSGAWELRAREMRVQRIDLSLSHAGEYAVAAVVLSGGMR